MKLELETEKNEKITMINKEAIYVDVEGEGSDPISQERGKLLLYLIINY
jgi:hypothetical protein